MTATTSTSPSAASLADWVEGARPRTLPAAFSPVAAGTAVALAIDGFDWLHALLALLVAVALQIGVNFANDYSDGIRGTDEDRVGPMRLVGSGRARPRAVLTAAMVCFGIGAAAGLALVVLTAQWWMLAVGVAALLAAWFYTGGKHPYGYYGLGELFVFVFFGLVAVVGTTWVQALAAPPAAWTAAVGIGALACAILVTNNLRDLAGDREAGKRTLAVRLGPSGTKALFVGLVAAAVIAAVLTAVFTTWWALLALVSLVFLVGPVLRVLDDNSAPGDLIKVLKLVGIGELVYAVGLLAGVLIARL
ncbi:1,4-dihydroxy-2-naphthoate polyprenyltransferase [Parenemella sanctibonifatiensis]|uniref:1,4-dihydroxy-2-naphthoate octaprenyltransferase n=1 Tax=Parenemella sanctibonifatiensis TaxID=2016505 RepID=A0A255EAS4_9ACTN|nr:1,4-dihydroxy-2-naphthoate polyprenyltransferase [Parenemella sanctibonifatiensis]OYN88669.1 1,4-dihydroxy-2-naphthoate polyprenyltransferase [Parenemella sanctibonifatiensis]